MNKYWKYLAVGALMFLLGTATSIVTGDIEGKASASGETVVVNQPVDLADSRWVNI